MRKVPRVEICGGIASGKTTLCLLLAEHGFGAGLENFQSNPFWEAFYQNPASTAFETELTFFLQHYHGIKTAHTQSLPRIYDHSLLLDLAYARVTLENKRLSIFENVFEEIWKEVRPPNLVIHLSCDPETELSRIRSRARPTEASIGIEYLSALNSSIKYVLEEFHSTVDVHVIDSANANFATDSLAKVEVVAAIVDVISTRI